MPGCYFCGEDYPDGEITQKDVPFKLYLDGSSKEENETLKFSPYHVHRRGALGRAGGDGAIIGTAGGIYATNPGVQRHYKRVYPLAENIRWLEAGIALRVPFFIFTTHAELVNDIGNRNRRNTLLFEIMFLHAMGYSFVLSGGKVIAELTAAPRLAAGKINEMLEQASKCLDMTPKVFWDLWRAHFINQVLPGFPAAAAPAVAAAVMFQIHLKHDANGMEPRFRSSLNRSPQAISIMLSGQHVAIQATHWAWHSARVLRVEGPPNLSTRFRLLPNRSALVSFDNPGFLLSAVDIIPNP
ncbi:MAG: hypothetical protein JWQ98_1084 [Chlorobi bacterium]|nr:hypothetical protein [Chlorobiota bacterium]